MSAVEIVHLREDAERLMDQFSPGGLVVMVAKGSLAALLALRLEAKGARGAATARRAARWLAFINRTENKESSCP